MSDVLTLVGSLRARSLNRALAAAAPALHLAGLGGIPVFSEDLETGGLPGSCAPSPAPSWPPTGC